MSPLGDSANESLAQIFEKTTSMFNMIAKYGC